MLDPVSVRVQQGDSICFSLVAPLSNDAEGVAFDVPNLRASKAEWGHGVLFAQVVQHWHNQY
jgi:hypothetical protein